MSDLMIIPVAVEEAMKDYYTFKELAERWDVHPNTVGNWWDKGGGDLGADGQWRRKGAGKTAAVLIPAAEVLRFEKEKNLVIFNHS